MKKKDGFFKDSFALINCPVGSAAGIKNQVQDIIAKIKNKNIFNTGS